MQTIPRLIEQFRPTHYNLSLTLDEAAMRFSGTVTITGMTTLEQRTVHLHAKALTIRNAQVDGREVASNLEDDTLILEANHLLPGEHVVVIGFEGDITESMHGLYPSTFEHDGVKKQLLATQFESHHAREVFPCIDEPEAKATFDVTLTTRPEITVLGNMPIADQRTENERLVTTFQTSPTMSTYLVAFVAGELHAVSGETKDGVAVSIWATPAQPAESLTFALDIAIRTTEFFNEYFGVPYPLPKADHVALPDFSSGAMENWGLITYREVALLAHPQTTPIEQKQMVALVIAHELSHQWFGNLVTMKWWNDLWLNESFANMMEYVAIDALQPDWNIWLEHAGQEVVQALRRDALDGVQAVRVDVNHPDEISSLFDPSIVYAKGGRLLRMVQFFLGDEAMQKGLQNYFTQFTYQNTEADDLWKCLEEASGQPIADMMHGWIRKPGYPIVTMRRIDPNTIELEQSQFFIGAHESSDAQWMIPLATNLADAPVLMTDKKIYLKTAELPILNQQSASHYIVRYEGELETELRKTVTGYPEVERLKVLHEYTLLAQAEAIESGQLVDLLEVFRHETSEPVWAMISLAVAEIRKFVEPESVTETHLKQLVHKLAKPLFTELGWNAQEDETEERIKLRSLVINMMLYAEDPDVVAEALRRYKETVFEALDPELRVSLLSTAVKFEDPSTVVADLLAHHAAASSSELREDIAGALTSTRSLETVQQLLGLIKDSETIRPQDVARWLLWLLRNRYARSATWQWIRNEWSWLEKTFSGDKSYDAYPRYTASILTTQTELDEYKAFFTPLLDSPALRRNIEIGLTELTHRVGLMTRQKASVERALADQ